MTRGQRKAHLMLWLVLGPLALIGLALAVAWRPAEPVEHGPLPGISGADDPEMEAPQADPYGGGAGR